MGPTDQSFIRDASQAGGIAAPPVIVAAAHTFAGMTISDWVGIGTLLYLAVSTAYLLWKWFGHAMWKTWRHRVVPDLRPGPLNMPPPGVRQPGDE